MRAGSDKTFCAPWHNAHRANFWGQGSNWRVRGNEAAKHTLLSGGLFAVGTITGFVAEDQSLNIALF
jgi:hypothetical protein